MNIHIFINIEIKSQANALLSISWLAIINTLAEPAQLCLAAFTPEQEKCGCQTMHTSQKTAVFQTGLTNWYSQQWHSVPSASLGHKHINTWYFCGLILDIPMEGAMAIIHTFSIQLRKLSFSCFHYYISKSLAHSIVCGRSLHKKLVQAPKR